MTTEPTRIRYGMTLSSEEHSPTALVELGVLAEQRGFDFVSISDHYHPWTDVQGHSPFVWTVLGALAGRTSSIDVGVGVTCPTMRIHPTILAQATATTAQLFGERFFWGVGSGEALNEHVLGDRWPRAAIRLAMLEEAIRVVRDLWSGQQINHDGRYYQVENARIYDTPTPPPPIIVSAFGPEAAQLAGRIGDGLWISGASADTVATWRDAGGSGPVFAQLTLCWAADRDDAVATAYRVWPNAGIPGQLSQDLPTPAHFEQASTIVSADMIAEAVPCGPDPEPVLERIAEMIEAGVDHVYLHQIGADQEGFLQFWEGALQPALPRTAPSR